MLDLVATVNHRVELPVVHLLDAFHLSCQLQQQLDLQVVEAVAHRTVHFVHTHVQVLPLVVVELGMLGIVAESLQNVLIEGAVLQMLKKRGSDSQASDWVDEIVKALLVLGEDFTDGVLIEEVGVEQLLLHKARVAYEALPGVPTLQLT